jgi:hypothetical protein
MFIAGGAPHNPVWGVIVGKGEGFETAARVGIDCSVARLAGSGVQVAPNGKGVAVEIRSAGPRGRCHCALQSQKANVAMKQTSRERKESMAFWVFVMTVHLRTERNAAQRQRLSYSNT